MKRLFFALVGAAIGAAVSYWLMKKRLDRVQSALDVYEKREKSIEEDYRAKNEAFLKEEAEHLASMSPQERLNYEMRQAIFRSKYPEPDWGDDNA
jgi:hypothetical protein